MDNLLANNIDESFSSHLIVAFEDVVNLLDDLLRVGLGR
jgi:hypothetical protein